MECSGVDKAPKQHAAPMNRPAGIFPEAFLENMQEHLDGKAQIAQNGPEMIAHLQPQVNQKSFSTKSQNSPTATSIEHLDLGPTGETKKTQNYRSFEDATRDLYQIQEGLWWAI